MKWLQSLDGRRHAVVWLLCIGFFAPTLFLNRALVPTNPDNWVPWSAVPDARSSVSNQLMADSLMLTVPWRVHNAESLRKGEIPFWNPAIGCGYPHLAALQSNALYPPVVVFDLLDPIRGIAWAMALHIGLAGSLMYSFLRRRDFGCDASAVGAVAFEFNGFFMVRMSAPSYVFSGAWTPLLLLGLWEIRKGFVRPGVWKVALSVAMAFLGGHPQVFVFMLGIGAVFISVECLAAGQPGQTWRPLIVATGAVLSGILIAGFQLLPFVEFMGESGRQPIAFDAHQKVALPIFSGLQALVPDAFGHPVDRDYWLTGAADRVDLAPEARRVWGFNYCGENLFTGPIPLVLALVALFGDRRRDAMVFGGLALFAVLVVFGAPLQRFVYDAVPLLRSSRPDRMVFVIMVALPILSAVGFDFATRRSNSEGRRHSLVFPSSMAAVVIVFVAWRVLVHPGWHNAYGPALQEVVFRLGTNLDDLFPQLLLAIAGPVIVVVIWRCGTRREGWAAGLSVVAVAAPMFWFGWKFNPPQPYPLFDETENLQVVPHNEVAGFRIARFRAGNVMPPNTGQVMGLADVHLASAAGLGRYFRLISSVDPRAIAKDKYFLGFLDERVLGCGLLDVLGVKWLFAPSDLAMPDGIALGSGKSAYRRVSALPRFRLVSEIEVVDDPAEARAMVVDPTFDHRRRAVVENAVVELRDNDHVPGRDGSSVTVISESPHHEVLEVSTPRPCLLVTNQVMYPGWEGEIAGEEAPLVLVNTAFRGIVVFPGRHLVEFRYRPESFLLGCRFSLIGFGLVIWLSTTRRFASGAAG
jgi:hypothetical protein